MASGKSRDLSCVGCNRTFTSVDVFRVHFSPHRPACAYNTNEEVVDLKEFTLKNVFQTTQMGIGDTDSVKRAAPVRRKAPSRAV